MKKPVLIIITEGHPGIDTGFIHPELNVIHEFFSRIEVYPTKWEDTKDKFDFPSNIKFSKELSEFLKTFTSAKKKVKGFLSPLFLQNIYKTKPRDYISLLNSCGYASLFGDWILKKGFNTTDTVFYTYWLTLPALSLSWLKEKGRVNYFISRIHGYDLFDERGDRILNFFKPYIFRNISCLFCISDNGKSYLSERHNAFTRKFKVCRLGIANNRDLCRSGSERLELVSCSFISSVKRIELLIKGIEWFQKRHPGINIRWTHIGGGSGLESIRKKCVENLGSGSWLLKGNMEIGDILDLYSASYFDCFMNVSESEGLPVSIMEAQSAGIPVIATAVGGTSEIVNSINGFLLSPDPSDEEISDAIFNVYSHREEWKEKRALSRKNWQENFKAETNYRQFGEEVISLFKK